jgi:hypothetical protein
VFYSLHFLEPNLHRQPQPRFLIPLFAPCLHPVLILRFPKSVSNCNNRRLLLGTTPFLPVAHYLFANPGACRNLSNTPDLAARRSFPSDRAGESRSTNCACITAGRGPNNLRMGKKPLDVMGFIGGLVKRIPSSPNPPSLDDIRNEKAQALPGLSFFRRRIRLKGNSSISIPLGFVLLFPCIVVLLILIIVVQHPSTPGRILMPAGSPPSIR